MSSQQAFTEAVAALSRDMPILMHGSGDVLPDQVDPATVQMLSELTARYISNLVDAAIDAQELLAGGQQAVARPPPPRYPRSRNPPLPSEPEPATTTTKKKSDKDDNTTKSSKLKKRPHRPDVDYWDEPLPEPKIVAKKRAKLSTTTDMVLATAGGPSTLNEDEAKSKPVHIDQWVGAAGVDLWEQSRSRAAFVRMPDAVGVQCFIFPICHDGFLYGKVMQVQASRRAIAPVLVDSVLLDLVRTEGALARRHAPRRKKTDSKKSSNNDSGDADVEDEKQDEEDEMPQDDGAAWPGLEFLLPVHAITEAMVDGSL